MKRIMDQVFGKLLAQAKEKENENVISLEEKEVRKLAAELHKVCGKVLDAHRPKFNVFISAIFTTTFNLLIGSKKVYSLEKEITDKMDEYIKHVQDHELVLYSKDFNKE